jgi:uncharacterized protein
MPIGNYSDKGDSTGVTWQQAAAISEPATGWSRKQAIEAKEPDRQPSATHKSARSRGGMEEGYSPQEQPRSRRAAGGATRSRGAQARRAGGSSQTARRSAAPEPRTTRAKKSRRGFAAMSPEQQREIARKGGLTVSRNRRHMADIGRVGGEHSHGGRRARR